MADEKITHDVSREDQASVIRLGLVAAPDLAEDIAWKVEDKLIGILPGYVDDRVHWEIEIVIDPLTGATADSTEILEEIQHLKKQYGWEYAVCITDLPIFRDRRLVVAEASAGQQTAWISLPALGAAPMLRRVQEAVLQLTNEIYHGSAEPARERQQRKLTRTGRADENRSLKGARHLLRERLSERLSPITRIRPGETGTEVDVRFIVNSRFSGGVRMLSGMVRANRPWTIFPSFKRVVAAAFATGAYGLIFPTLWQLSGAYEMYRFVLLMLSAMGALVVWLIVAHGLWENSAKAKSPYLAKLYNAATAFTLSIAVLFYYAVLFFLFLLAVVIFVPGSMLESAIGEPVSLTDYLALAWLASSVATIAGSLGAALESEETVRNATYGYRQRRRYEEIENEMEQEHNST